MPALLARLTAALACVTLSLVTPAAFAGAPQAKTQVPGFYRMMVGDFEITALYDGFIDIDVKALRNATAQQIQSHLARLFQEGPKVQTAVNAYLVNTGQQLLLVDAGTAKVFGPSLGFLLDNLKAAGYEASQVDAVLLTHLHPDHANGLLTADGKIAFPNARVLVQKEEADFWLSEAIAAKAPKDAQPFFKMAVDATAPYRASNKFETFAKNAALFPGVTAVAAPGHTVGHTGYLIESKGQRLLIWGDLVHNYATQLANPNIAIEFDTDPKTAIATRKAMFRRAAKEKLMVAGMHLPFPGIGRLRARGETYVWVPVEFGPLR